MNKHGAFYLYDCYEDNNLCIDGHPTFTRDGRYMVTDSYPDKEQMQRLIVLDTVTKKSLIIARLFANYYRNPSSCDLHPKLSVDNDYLVVDTAFDSKHHMIVFKLNWNEIKVMNENKRIAFNSVIIYLRLCVVSLISIILSRVVLDALGVSDFGLYNVVGGIVLLLNVINSSMTSTTYRYLAFEIGKKENGNPNKIFNTSRIIHLAFAALIVLVGEPLGELYIINYLNVASESIPDARFPFVNYCSSYQYHFCT